MNEEEMKKVLDLLYKCYSYLEEVGLLEDFNEYAGVSSGETQEASTEEQE